jgi:hypothetical protein
MLVDESGTVYLSQAMAERVRFAAGKEHKTVIGEL